MDGRGRFLRSLIGTLAGVRFGERRRTELDLPLLVGEQPRRRLWPFRSRASVSMPMHERVPRHAGVVLSLGLFSAIGTAGVALGGHMATFRDTFGEPHHALARALGLGIERVTISGIIELHPREILNAAGINPKISLAFLNVEEVRMRLQAEPLVREATVRKLYPSELTVHIVEREPFALWQLDGEISIIAADGTVIDQLHDARFAHLPLVVGPGANLKARDYVQLLQLAGPLRAQIRGATLVSGRRWNLKMRNGLDVRLPEEEPFEAMERLVRLSATNNLLDRDILAVDLRQADRITLRLSEEAAQARAEMLAKMPKRRGSDA